MVISQIFFELKYGRSEALIMKKLKLQSFDLKSNDIRDLLFDFERWVGL